MRELLYSALVDFFMVDLEGPVSFFSAAYTQSRKIISSCSKTLFLSSNLFSFILIQVSSSYCLASNHIKRWIFVPSRLECLLKKSWPRTLLLCPWMLSFTTKWSMLLCLWPMWRMPITQLVCWHKPRYGTSWVPKIYMSFLATEIVSPDPCSPSSTRLLQHGVSKSSE